jgi:DNA-directed RNA polymerase subunit L
MELDVQNDTDDMIVVTTEDFTIRNKENGNLLKEEEVRRIFPPFKFNDSSTYIDFARIRARLGDSIPGEQIKLTCEFSVHTAKDSSTFNVVSKCSYGNTPDVQKANAIWEDFAAKLQSEGTPADDIEFQKRNFYLLDAQRHFVENSVDFVIQSVGVFENREIVKKACVVLQNKLVDLIQAIDSDIVPILNSETTVEFSYDIILEEEDYTLGKVLEYLLYERYYVHEKVFTYCGFKKFHPHNSDSTIRVAYVQNADKRMVGQHLRIACVEAKDIFERVRRLF